jgi:hypothetical protein
MIILGKGKNWERVRGEEIKKNKEDPLKMRSKRRVYTLKINQN